MSEKSAVTTQSLFKQSVMSVKGHLRSQSAKNYLALTLPGEQQTLEYMLTCCPLWC